MTVNPLHADRRQVLAMTAGAALVPQLGAAAQAATAPRTASVAGRDQPFNEAWLFRRGAGEGLQAVALDDAEWRRVDLPHDWSIEDLAGPTGADQIGPFTKASVGGKATGQTVGGEGWYRKHLRLDRIPRDARVEVLFDGVHAESDVWLNGVHLARQDYGYVPFAVDLTPHLNRDGDNVLAVRVRNLGENSRWYAGSGIYREVRLDVLPAGARLARWGVAAATREITGGQAHVEVSTAVEAPDGAVTLTTRMRDASGKVVAEATGAAGANTVQALAVRGARLWSPEDPYLYTLESELRRGAAVIDRVAEPFGVRIITIDPQQGLAINGRPAKLRGGCVHHDNGLLGARAFADADERRVALIKARGYNAIRSSHNPSSRNFRRACDKLGMLLIEEISDMWHVPKLPDDFSRAFRDGAWESVATAMVLGARNSPSVFMWSIGNEIPGRSSPEGVKWQWLLANTVRRLDPTRPVTAAINGVLGPLLKASPATARVGQAGELDNAATIFLDVTGYNYRLSEIESDHAERPRRIIYGSETYPSEAYDYWALAQRAPYMLGEFVWTAMDYLGEAGIGASANINAGGVPFYFPGWPWVNAWCGDLDLLGDQKAPSRYRDVVWGLSGLEIAVQRPVPAGKVEFVSQWGWSDELPSWTWAGHEGEPVAVRLYTSGDRAEVWLNGRKVADKAVTPADKMRGEVKVPYAPGKLEVIAFRGGREVGRRKLETTSAPARLRLRPERAVAQAGRDRLLYVHVDVLDGAGRLVLDADPEVALAIRGPVELAGFGGGGPLAVGSFQALEARAYRGRALAILRGTGAAGTVRVTASANNLTGSATTVRLT